jgi:Concanavalin A-like lectin/glucanases superfamily
MQPYIFLVLFLVLLIGATPVHAQKQDIAPEPAVYLNFDEGSGNFVMDNSGHGNSGTLHNVSRIGNGGCNQALLFSNPDSYAAIPFRALNHPSTAITVSAWFYLDNFTPAALVSAYHDGGYRLGFDDGNDLWWTVNLEGSGDVSLPVQHENIAPHQWHQVTGTYDGNTVKIFLDGVLRNQVNATGTVHYRDNNYVILGAEAGPSDVPAQCPRHLFGGLDEVRIYPVALSYGQMMDDRFRCQEGDRLPPGLIPGENPSSGTCESVSGSVRPGSGETEARVLSFPDKIVNGTWQVSVQPGSILRVNADDYYAKVYPDAWYLEVADEHGKPARTIAFPGRNNAPAETILPSGNATVTVRYFSGGERFPAKVALRLENLPPPPPRQDEPKTILENPIIVIYSASWATVVALILVMIWLHRRKKAGKTELSDAASPQEEEKKL